MKKVAEFVFVCMFAVLVSVLVSTFKVPQDNREPMHPKAPAPAPTLIEEDEPGWDCRTMGNRSCGKVEA